MLLLVAAEGVCNALAVLVPLFVLDWITVLIALFVLDCVAVCFLLLCCFRRCVLIGAWLAVAVSLLIPRASAWCCVRFCISASVLVELCVLDCFVVA